MSEPVVEEMIAPPKYRSVSQRNSYTRCPYQYYLERMKKAWQRPAAWLPMGSAVHEGVELYEKSGRRMSREDARLAVAEAYSREVGKYTAETPNFQAWFASGPYRGPDDVVRRFDLSLEHIERYIDWTEKHPGEKVWSVVADEYLGVGKPEMKPASELEFNTVFGKVPVRGFIDLVIEDDEGLVVRDVKGLALDTVLCTPDGWTTMGDVKVGDRVIGSDGKPCNVVVKSGVKRIGTYVVTFDDGSKVVCDHEHIWWTQVGRDPEAKARSIEEIIDTLLDPRGQAWHRVPVTQPLDLPDADLPITPYALGCWLGDGKKSSSEVTKDEALFVELEKSGCGNKHVPAMYLRSSVRQRTALLQGLMDTDGSWNTSRKTAVFSSCDEGLATAAAELLYSLGQRPSMEKVRRTGFGKEVDSWTVEFNPTNGLVPFRHPRKLASMFATGTKSGTKSTGRLITSVEEGPDVKTACIGVDSPNNTYLCGEGMIPTHNTGNTPGDDFQLGVYAAAIAQEYDVEQPTRGDYFMTRTGKPTIPYKIGEWTPDRVAEEFEQLEDNIQAEKFDPDPSPDKCRFCSVASSCDFRQG